MITNKKLQKLLQDPKQFFLDSRHLQPIFRRFGLIKKTKQAGLVGKPAVAKRLRTGRRRHVNGLISDKTADRPSGRIVASGHRPSSPSSKKKLLVAARHSTPLYKFLSAPSIATASDLIQHESVATIERAARGLPVPRLRKLLNKLLQASGKSSFSDEETLLSLGERVILVARQNQMREKLLDPHMDALAERVSLRKADLLIYRGDLEGAALQLQESLNSKQSCRLLKKLVSVTRRRNRQHEIEFLVRRFVQGVAGNAQLQAIDTLAENGFDSPAIELLSEIEVRQCNWSVVLAHGTLLAKTKQISNLHALLGNFLARVHDVPESSQNVQGRIGALIYLGQSIEAERELIPLLHRMDPEAALAAIGIRVLDGDFAGAATSLDRAIEIGSRLLEKAVEVNDSSHFRLAGEFLLKLHAFFDLVQWRHLRQHGLDLSCLETLEVILLKFYSLSSTRGRKCEAIAFSALAQHAQVLFKLNHRARAREIISLIEPLAKSKKLRLLRLAKILGNAFESDETRVLHLALAAVSDPLTDLEEMNEEQARSLNDILQILDLLHSEDIEVYVDRAVALLTTAGRHGLFGVPAFRALALRLVMLGKEKSFGTQWLQNALELDPLDADLLNLMTIAQNHLGDVLQGNKIRREIAQMALAYETVSLSSHAEDGVGDRDGDGDGDEEEDDGMARKWNARLDLIKFEAMTAPWDPRSVTRYFNRNEQEKVEKFWGETSAILCRHRPVPDPKGVVFLSSYHCQATASMATLPLTELQRRGYAVVPLIAGMAVPERSGLPMLDQFRGIFASKNNLVRYPKHIKDTFFDWKLDWDNRRIEALGMNYWQPIFERINQVTKRYQFDVTLPRIAGRIKQLIVELDRTLFVCEMIREEIAAQGIPVRFISANWQFPPYAGFRIYCEARGAETNMNFVAVSPGYENYYSNLQEQFGETVTMVNMTRHRTTRAPFLAIPERFHSWVQQEKTADINTRGQLTQWLSADRAGISNTAQPEAKAIYERIKAHRAAGGKVIAAFGKIVYDLAVPHTGGPAHSDMADWLNHTIQCAAKSSCLFLIKPHPHELRHQIAGRPVEFFLDMIKEPVPDNVILLQHKWFNIKDLVPIIDLGVLWNGTTSLELGAAGVPTVVCDDWGTLDYPVGHCAPKDRVHYEAIIRNPSLARVGPDHQALCAELLRYLASEEVMRPYHYAKRGITNAFVGYPEWRAEKVNTYFSDGDRFVEMLADEFEFDDTGMEAR